MKGRISNIAELYQNPTLLFIANDQILNLRLILFMAWDDITCLTYWVVDYVKTCMCTTGIIAKHLHKKS